MPTDALDKVTDWIMAAGGLGTAAFGVVQTLKGTSVGTWGVGRIVDDLGEPGMGALTAVYGDGAEALLRNTFRRGEAEVATFLKNGLRLALQTDKAAELATYLSQDADRLETALERLNSPLTEKESSQDLVEERAVLGRIEVAIDARVDAAVCAAREKYASSMRFLASCFAVAAGTLAGLLLGHSRALALDGSQPDALGGAVYGFLIGIAAVPIAPIAKDLVSLLGSARDALQRNRRT